ncbi:hypothetical protein CQ13_07730 [Bradyrhizobium retamae]|uniref:Phage tail collar domain-containing protein n=2 Tax=Bradyrhizobium retamae TaxID=1300035 RepID=A0A0R3MVM3_9BRAD|nr:hypothetical protein CQ13_07730 [Bradyrhizobium retamae]
MAPSAVNDGVRGAMARLREWGNDISGAIVATGTGAAYSVASNQVFDNLTHLNAQIVAFTPHATNTGTCTLNVDGLGAKPLRSAPGVELQAGTLVQGTPYLALYNNSDQVFYLPGFYGNAYNVPLAGGMDFWGAAVPNSSFAFPVGQAISRTTYASLFAIMGTTYGAGDGTTTFNLPDKTGRVSAMKEAAATRLTASGFGGNSTLMGAVGGDEKRSLAANQIPSLTSSGNNSISVTSSQSGIPSNCTQGNYLTHTGPSAGVYGPGRPGPTEVTIGQITSSGNNTVTVAYTNGAQAAVALVQPTIVCNYIIRIL